MQRFANLSTDGDSSFLPEYYANNIQLVQDFPKTYVNNLDKLLFPAWYTACFSKSYHNASMWANYGDGHKGVCLIFDSAITDAPHSLFPDLRSVPAKAIWEFRYFV